MSSCSVGDLNVAEQFEGSVALIRPVTLQRLPAIASQLEIVAGHARILGAERQRSLPSVWLRDGNDFCIQEICNGTGDRELQSCHRRHTPGVANY